MSNKAIISALNKVLTEQFAPPVVRTSAPPVVRSRTPVGTPVGSPVQSTPGNIGVVRTVDAARSAPLSGVFGGTNMNPGLSLTPTRSSRAVEIETNPAPDLDRIDPNPFGTPSIDMPIVTTAPTRPSLDPNLDRILGNRPVSTIQDKPSVRTTTATDTATTPDIVPDALTLAQPALAKSPLAKTLIGVLTGLAGKYLGQTPPKSQKPKKGNEKDLTGPSLLNLNNITTPRYKYDSTKFAAELNPIFQKETSSQSQINKDEREKAFKVPVQESQKPGFERNLRIRQKDNINPEPQMPRRKDTLLGDPTPEEIAAKMRDILIKQRSKDTLKSIRPKSENNPLPPNSNNDQYKYH